MGKKQDLTKQDERELQKQLSELTGKLRELRFAAASGQTRNPHQIKETKKMIARILTELNKRVKSNAK